MAEVGNDPGFRLVITWDEDGQRPDKPGTANSGTPHRSAWGYLVVRVAGGCCATLRAAGRSRGRAPAADALRLPAVTVPSWPASPVECPEDDAVVPPKALANASQ
jgi:hypothetical protein